MTKRISAEKNIRIKLPGNKYMPGCLRGSLKRPVILMVHGLTGHMQEHIFFNGARYFDKHEISSLRINLYSDSEDSGTRCLTDCTLDTHAEDINEALKFLRKNGAGKIFALGHSYGAPSIMLADQNLIDGYILWDASYKPDFIKLFSAKKISKDLYKIDWGVEFLVSRKMKNYSESLDWDAMVKKITKPLLAIYAAKGILKKITAHYASIVQGPTKLIGIPNATHCFDEPGAEEKLFDATIKWIQSLKKSR